MKAKSEGESFDEPAPTTEAGKETAPVYIQAPPLSLPVESGAEEVKKTPLDYISSGFTTVVEAVKKTGTKAKEKIDESGIGTKISNAASTAGHFIADKTKSAAAAVKTQGNKIAENETMKNITTTTKKGLTKAGAAISGVRIWLHTYYRLS